MLTSQWRFGGHSQAISLALASVLRIHSKQLIGAGFFSYFPLEAASKKKQTITAAWRGSCCFRCCCWWWWGKCFKLRCDRSFATISNMRNWCCGHLRHLELIMHISHTRKHTHKQNTLTEPLIELNLIFVLVVVALVSWSHSAYWEHESSAVVVVASAAALLYSCCCCCARSTDTVSKAVIGVLGGLLWATRHSRDTLHLRRLR